MSISAIKRCTPEWRRAKSEAYSTKLPFQKVSELYEAGHTQEEIAHELNTTQKVVWKFMKRNGIQARVAAKRDQWQERNHQWKGDRASYAAFHYRLSRLKGEPDYCEVCGTREAKRFEWANLTGRLDDVDDYKRMCKSCHARYDEASHRRDARGCFVRKGVM